MKLPPISLVIEPTPSFREKIYVYLRDLILSGGIPGGFRLVETQLAKQINVSRTPVREALHLLEREGLLESIPKVGYRVKELKWDEVEEICEIRKVNEILAAGWAMHRMSPAQLRALEENLTISESEAREGDPKSFAERDAEFHDILVRASGSSRLVELCEQLRRHMLRYRIESLYLRETALRAIVGHRRIVECLKRKDMDGIASAVGEHLDFARDSVHRHAFRERGRETR